MRKLNNANGGSYTFNWDNADRLVTEKRLDNTARHFVYNDTGSLTQIITQAINKTGETVSKSLLLDYDKNQRLLAKANDDTQTVYAYDEMARLLGVEVIPTTYGKQKGIPASKLTFSYDKAGRLCQETQVNGEVNYQWDALDNLVELTLPNQQTINWLRYGSGHVRAMSFAGQLVNEFSRDKLHREVMRTQGRLSQFRQYDVLGRRISQSSHFTQDEHLPEIHSGKLWRLYQYSSVDNISYHSEVNGQPLELTDSEGTILWSATYNSWGKLLRLNQINDREGRVFGINQPLRYAGQYADNETGLHYNTFRYYDPEIGRFTQQDLIGLMGEINLYQYAPDPLTYTDPLGWWTVKIDGYIIKVHANEIDPWPSIPHGHIYDENLVIDKNGNIFKAHNGLKLIVFLKKIPKYGKKS